MAKGARCTVCGQLFAGPLPAEQYWDQPGQFSTVALDDSFSDLYSNGSSAETVIGRPDDRQATVPFTPVADPWSSKGGRLGAEPGSKDAFVAPLSGTQRRDGGPPAWVLGLVGVVIIAAVAVAALILVAKPLVNDRIEAATSDAISTALEQATVVPDAVEGTVVVTEQEVNRTLRTNRDAYQPVEDARVQIRRNGITVAFTVYGVSGKMTGSVKVRNGRIAITNPKLDGVADQVIDVERVARNAELAIHAYLLRNNLRPTAVDLATDSLTITTEPIR